MDYKDTKWSITYNDKDGLRIHVQCECGNRHDIHLDSIGNFAGRGTLFNQVNSSYWKRPRKQVKTMGG